MLSTLKPFEDLEFTDDFIFYRIMQNDETTCQEDKDFILNDETYKFFFNAAAAENEKDLEIHSFLNYIKSKEPTDELTDKISKLIDEIKNREQNKEAYMIEHLKVRDNIMEGLREGLKQGHEEGLQQGLQQGREQGAQQKAIEAAENLLRMKVGTPEQIAQAQGLPLEKVLELQQQIEK